MTKEYLNPLLVDKLININIESILGYQPIEIKIEDYSGLSYEEKLACKIAANMVLDKKLKSKDSRYPLEILTGVKLVENDKEVNGVSTVLEAKKKIAISFSSESSKIMLQQFGKISMLILVIAHEATHIAQQRNGAETIDSLKIIKEEGFDVYANDPSEIEAWTEALDVLKAIRPEVTGRINIGKMNYRIPRKSSYKINIDQVPDIITGHELNQTV